MSALPLHPEWPDLAIRLAAAVIAGLIVGFDRGEHNQAAGLRTTMLVCVAACGIMILVNLLLDVTGKVEGSFVQIDVMRLPLGFLTGMGFIGAGAIMKRGDMVMGVTTAATLWFMAVVGLCFGAGQIAFGTGLTAIAVFALLVLRTADVHIRRRLIGVLTLSARQADLSETEIRGLLTEAGYTILIWGASHRDGGEAYELRIELQWSGRRSDLARTPPFVNLLASRAGVSAARWEPQILST